MSKFAFFWVFWGKHIRIFQWCPYFELQKCASTYYDMCICRQNYRPNTYKSWVVLLLHKLLCLNCPKKHFQKNRQIILLDKKLFLGWDHLKPSKTAFLKFEIMGQNWSLLHGEQFWNVFHKKLKFFTTASRKTWTSWMTRGWRIYS